MTEQHSAERTRWSPMPKRRTRGDGGLIQRHDAPTCPPLVDGQRPDHTCQGRWVGTVDVKLPGGGKKRKYIYGRTQATVRKALAKAVRERDAGTLVTSTTVEQWLTYWLENIAARTLKPRTLAGYRGYITTHLIPRLGRHRLDGLRPEHIRALHDQMRGAGKSPATILQAHAILAKALNDAVNDGKIALNPCDRVARPKAPKNHRRGLSVEQASLLLRATDDLRWWLAVFYGMRQGEVLGLRWGDIDLDAQVIRVEQTLVNLGKSGGLVFGTPKSATSRRTIPLTPLIEARVRLALAHIDGEPDPERSCSRAPTVGPCTRPLTTRRGASCWPRTTCPAVALHAARNTART
jgi:integrase